MKLDIQMFADGKVVIDTELNSKNFENGLNRLQSTTQNAGSTIKSIVAGLGISKAISMAISTINNSIDSSISRLDTLRNFPKVMSNLGIAGDKAEASITKMSDKLSGLPTTLDAGASAVQRFTSANSDVEKSTDIFLALNNAILAGGASTDIQTSALEQLSQAYAKGKPDMMEWRTAMTAMPAQLKQVATAMGYVSTDELGEALRNGTVSMDEFMDTIVQLNEQGIEGFENFETQARNSVGGIGTSITVAKTQIVKGVTDIIDAFDQSFEDTKFGSLSGLIKIIGENAKETLDKIAEYIPNIVSNLNTLIPMIGLLSVGFSTINFDGINGISNALGGLVGKVNSTAGIITNVVSSGFGFAALGGLILIAMGLAEENFGEGINKMLDTAIEKGPEIITNLAEGLVSKMPELMEKGTELLSKLIEVVNTNLPVIIQAGAEILTQLITGFAQALPTLIPQIVETLIIIVESLLDNIDMIIDAGIQLIMGLADGLINALPILIDKAPEIIDKIVNALADNLPKLMSVGPTLIMKLAEGIIKNLPNLLSKIPGIIGSLVNGFLKYVGKMADVGKNLVKGIWNGIKDATKWLMDKIKEFAKGIVDGIKGFLGIKSPSRVMKEQVGKFMAQGIGVGFEDELDNIYRDMEKAINFENAKLQANVETGKVFNTLANTTPVYVHVDADVEMDNTKVGRIITPVVSETLKTGGLR